MSNTKLDLADRVQEMVLSLRLARQDLKNPESAALAQAALNTLALKLAYVVTAEHNEIEDELRKAA